MGENELTDCFGGHGPVREILFRAEPAECRAADRHARQRIVKLAIPSWAATLYTSSIILASLFAAMAITGLAGRLGGTEADLLVGSLALFCAVFFIMGMWRRWAVSRIDRLAAGPDGTRCGEERMVLENGRLHRFTSHSESWLPLSSIRETVLLEKVIVLYLDAVTYFFIPRRTFPSPAAEKEFVSALRSSPLAADPAPAEPVPAESSEQQAATATVVPDNDDDGQSGPVAEGKAPRPIASLADGIFTNIRCGIRLAFFFRSDPDRLNATPGALATLAIFDIVLHLLLSLARVGTDGYFSIYSFASAVCHIPLMLLAGLCVARLTRRNDLALKLPACYLAIGITLDMAAALLRAAMDNGWIGSGGFSAGNDHFYGFYGWWVAAALAATLRMTAAAGSRRFAVAALLAVTLVLPLWHIPRGELWQEEYHDEEASGTAGVDSEEAFYAQPALLDDALARLSPGGKGSEDLYFVGFAGYGSQDVFKKEMEVIRDLFLQRFDTAGRSIVMINNPATALKYPIATATALKRVLNRVGETMDRDRDILFLYLTSHGSEDHRLSVELWPLELNDIDPSMLRRMLDESGIRWRVIVVSACYSGGFIEALKDEGTLVMTASDASSNSFGCSNDSDFTWFGKAVFDEELRHTFSFTAAFEQASVSIRKREVKEGNEPSNPLIHVGDAIRPRLLRLEKRLEALEQRQRQNLEKAGVAMK